MKPRVALALLQYASVSSVCKIREWMYSNHLKRWEMLILAVHILVFGYLVVQSYFTLDALSWLGITLLPYVLIVRQKGNYSLRYGLVLILMVLLYIWIPVRTLHFGVLTIGILFLIELSLGKINLLPLYLIGILSPFFRHTSIIFSFPIRLQLSEWAGTILNTCGVENTILGNVIRIGNTEFLVDVACMGLQMTETGLVMTLFLIAYYERLTKRYLSNLWVMCVVLMTLLLNIGSNLFRILLLIIFHIPPENPMHDVMGLLCLLVYVILPMGAGIRWLYQKKGKETITNSVIKVRLSLLYRSLGLCLPALTILIIGFQIVFRTSASTSIDNRIASPEGFVLSTRQDGITQLTNPKMLIYVKPITNFYVAEHSPLLCWRGSGYTFKHVETQIIKNTLVYTGILQKGNEQIYTAWWFDNGSHRTTDQLDWRWRMLQGDKNFCLVNVNVNTKEEVEQAVRWVLGRQLIQ